MAKVESVREVVKGLPDPVYLQKRVESGWRLVSLEWQRVAEGGEFYQPAPLEEVPYGLRVAEDCCHLEEEPSELRILTLMMDLIVQDNSLSQVAGTLNAVGFRTRTSAPWDPVAVFNMLPRLIDVGPRIFSSEEWEVRRRRLSGMV